VPSRAQPEGRQEALVRFWDTSREYYAQAAAANADPSAERRHLFGHLRGSERVLDLGSGSCENAQWLPAACRYVGVDLSMLALLLAREAARPGVQVRADGAALPFATQSVDVVLSTWALEHLQDPGRTFLEVGRVLRPGGLLLLVGSAWDLPYELSPSLDPSRRLEVAARRLRRQLLALATGRHDFDIVRRPRVLRDRYLPDADAVYLPQSALLVRFLRALGFEIVEHRRLPHGSDPAGSRGRLRRLLRRVSLWRHAWGNTLIVARRGTDMVTPRYRLRYL
jgi:SAM-dependent methyltransferase